MPGEWPPVRWIAKIAKGPLYHRIEVAGEGREAPPVAMVREARHAIAIADHALLLAGLIAGHARWEPLGAPAGGRGEIVIGGLRHATALDECGCPVLTAATRTVLEAKIP